MKHLSRVVCGAMVLLVAVTGVGLAQNLDKKLKGEYAFTTSLHCLTVDDPDDFDPFHRPIPAGTAVAFHRNMSSVGVRTFNGDGTSSLVAQVLIQRFDRTTFGDGGAIAVVTIDCPNGTYEVLPDDSFTQSYGHCTGEIIDPIFDTFTVDEITTAGQIGNNGKTLLIYDIGTEAQIGDTGRSICARSGSAVKK